VPTNYKEIAMIHVIAAIETVTGKKGEFLADFHTLIPLVRAEPGCIEYGSAVDVRTDFAAQIPFRENVVTVVEKWENVPALHAHMAAPHMLAWRERVKNWVVGVKVQIMEPA
jgi:quinol monooxygenase YgiN